MEGSEPLLREPVIVSVDPPLSSPGHIAILVELLHCPLDAVIPRPHLHHQPRPRAREEMLVGLGKEEVLYLPVGIRIFALVGCPQVVQIFQEGEGLLTDSQPKCCYLSVTLNGIVRGGTEKGASIITVP